MDVVLGGLQAYWFSFGILPKILEILNAQWRNFRENISKMKASSYVYQSIESFWRAIDFCVVKKDVSPSLFV
jgi:hypothetical protein